MIPAGLNRFYNFYICNYIHSGLQYWETAEANEARDRSQDVPAKKLKLKAGQICIIVL